MVPICVSIATEIGADPSAVLMACVIGGSCAYATPIGMPANTMVITAGGYTFKDYAKAGIPLIVVATIVSMVLLPISIRSSHKNGWEWVNNKLIFNYLQDLY